MHKRAVHNGDHIGHTHVGRYACRRNGIRMQPSRNNRRRRFNIIRRQSYTAYIKRTSRVAREPPPSRPRNFHFNSVKDNKEMRVKRKEKNKTCIFPEQNIDKCNNINARDAKRKKILTAVRELQLMTREKN